MRVEDGDGLASRPLRGGIERLGPDADEAVAVRHEVDAAPVGRPPGAREPALRLRDGDPLRWRGGRPAGRRELQRQGAVGPADHHRHPAVVPGEVRVEDRAGPGLEDRHLGAAREVPPGEALRPDVGQDAPRVGGEAEEAAVPADLAAGRVGPPCRRSRQGGPRPRPPTLTSVAVRVQVRVAVRSAGCGSGPGACLRAGREVMEAEHQPNCPPWPE